MDTTYKHQFIIRLGLLLIALLFLIGIFLGPIRFSFQAMFTSSDDVAHSIVWKYRVPRGISAILTGISLSVSGFLLQEYFRNPLAGPSVLGISSFSSLGVAVFIFLGHLFWESIPIQLGNLSVLFAFIGSIIALYLLIQFQKIVPDKSSLIIIGFILSAFSSAIIELMGYLSASEKIKSFLIWRLGDFSGLGYFEIIIYLTIVLTCLAFTLKIIKPLSLLILGEVYAESLGTDVQKLKFSILLISCILTASATAFTGPISFVGLIVPYLCRAYLRTSNFHLILQYVIVFGTISTLSLVIISENSPIGKLPINLISAFLGSPLVIYILIKRKIR